MKRIISMLLAMIMVLSTVSISVFAEEPTEEVTTASDEMQEPCIGKEVEYGSDLYSIQNDGLYVSKNYGRDTLMDEGTVTWVIERDGVLYWSKLDEYNTDIYRMNLSGDSKTTLVRLFVPVEAFDVVGDDVYYLYNGEITIVNVLTNEETSMGLYDCEGFYLDENGGISILSHTRATSENREISIDDTVELLSSVSKEEVINYARKFIGNPYVYGGTNLETGIDCSAYICRVYEHFGINLWSRRTQMRKLVDDGKATNVGTDLSKAELGDIIYTPGHVSLYSGNGNVVNALNTKHGIIECPATNAWIGKIKAIIRLNDEYFHTHTYGSNGKCGCGDTFMGDDGTHYYGKDIVSGFKGEIGIYKKSGSGSVDAYTAPNMNSIYQKKMSTKAEKKVSTETVHVIDIVSNNNGTLNFKVKYGDYENFVNRNKFLEKYKRSADLPSTITFHDISAPEALDRGKSFPLKGTIKSNYSLTKIVGSIIRASDNHVVLTETDSGGSSYDIRPKKINRNLTFNTLSPDTYYLKYEVWDSNNGHEVWTSSNFKVGNVGTVPTLRAGDITGGKKIDISCSDKNAIIKYTVDGGKEQSISAGGSKTIEFKTAGNHTVVAWSVSGTTVSTKGTQSVKIEKAWLPTIIDWFRRKAGVLADIDVEYGNTSAQVIISGEGDLYYTLNGSNPTTSSAKYTGPVEIKNSCTVKAISVQQGYAPSDVATKDIIIREPDAPSIQLSNTKQKIAQGKTATVSWSKVNYATKYVAYLYYNGECVDTYETTGTSASFKLPEVGKYTINVKAHNFVGYSPESNSVSIMSMAPVTVTIVDQVIREGEVTDDVVGQIQQNINEHDGEDAITVEGNVISVQKIDYDSLPARPMTPSKKGFTFAGYGEGMFVPATEDKTIYALYEVNYYTVEFWDSHYSEDGTKEVKKQIGATQEILYTYAATLPEVTSPDGYSLAGWNVDNTISTGFDYNYVDGNIKLYTSYTWTNKNLPAIVQIEHVERDEKCTSYAVDIKYINNNFETNGTQARLIISMYTSDGRMIYTQTEDVDMDLFKIGQTLTDTITLNYVHNVAKVSAVMVQVKNDKTGGAISEMDYTEDIEYPDASTYWDKWSEWSTTPYYSSDTRQVETKTQYRYTDKVLGTSNTTKYLDGWNYSYTTSSTGGWSGWSTSAVSAVSTDALYREVQSEKVPSVYKTQYRYGRWKKSGSTKLHFCKETAKSVHGGTWNDEYSSWRDTKISSDRSTTYYCSNTSHAHKNNEGRVGVWYSYWVDGLRYYWEETREVKVSSSYYKYRYRDTYFTHYFWKWGDFSAWSDIPYYNSDSRYVETRTLYRYRDEKPVYPGYNPNNDSGFEEQTIEKFEVSGNIEGLENDYTGKLATIMVYKKTNTDPTQEQLQYVDQIPLSENNAYSFTVNAKEKLDYSETGDFIVTLAIEGCDKLVNIDVIKAPVPTYAVNFYTSDGVQYGETQYVEYGGGVDVNAIGIPEKDGYRFVKWDKSVVNVTKNISVNAIFEAEKYPIVFVDHENETTEIQDIAYGEPVVTPTVENVEGKTFVGWEGLSEDGETLVEGSAIYTALWESEIYTVTFLDFEGNTVGEVQEVEYGEAAELPECVVIDGVTYPWDTNSEEWWNVTHDMTISPYKYTAREVAAPAVDVESGTYDEYLLVNLSADDEATIYYSEYEITEEDMERFVEMQENSDNVSLLADEGTTSDGETSSDAEENDYSYLTDIIVEYDEAIPVTGSTVIYAFTVKDGKMSSISTFEYDVNDFVPEEEEIVVDDDVEQITLPTITVKPGEEVLVPVTIKNNPGLNNLSIVLGYDTEKFTLISTDNGDVFADNEYTEELKDDGSCKFTWASATDNSNDGILVTLTFKAAENIEEGEYNIVFTDTVATDSTEEEKYLVLVDGTIVNSATVVGDVNGDEDIDFSDAILILKHDVGLTTLPSDKLPAGDVNGDGDVDFSDAILILKLDAGLITSFN